MKSYQLKDFRDGDAWLVLRLDAQVKDQAIDIYMTMDLPSGRLMAFQTIDTDVAEERHAQKLLAESFAQKRKWPKRILLTKGDPAEELLHKIVATHGGRLEAVPESMLEELVAPVKASYGQHVFSPSSMAYSALEDDVDEMDRESAKQMVPDAYAPCWCASGKKFKFCCKPIIREIVGAMTSAEDGKKDEALKFIAEAKRIAGETPEVLCREAIVWACFDKAKSKNLLDRALSVNPNHPRSNYIRGINLKALGDYPGAISAYQRAIEAYPKTDRFHLNETYNNLGTVYFESGQVLKAKAAWEQGLILMPSDKIIRRNLLELIYTNQKISTAERTMSSFVQKFFDKVH